jgi:hypothetical protein
MRTPAFVDIIRASEMLENCFEIMTRFAMTAEAPVVIKFREERAATALLSGLILFSALRFVWPTACKKFITSWI